jgi:hypothetical protein
VCRARGVRQFDNCRTAAGALPQAVLRQLPSPLRERVLAQLRETLRHLLG